MINQIIELLCFFGVCFSPGKEPIQDICPAYYCSYNMSRLDCQQITTPLLDQLIIKDNPRFLKWANCQPDNRTKNPSEDDIVWLRHKYNTFYEIPNHHFANYSNLNVLNLNDNPIQILNDKSFQGLSRLEFLHLQNNDIHYLEKGIFKPLQNVVWIDLSNNEISTLPEDIFPLNTKLKGLDLRKNPLTSLDLPAGHPIKSIEHLLLSYCHQLTNVQLGIDVLNITLENTGVTRMKASGSIRSIRAGKSGLTHLDLRGATLNGSLSDLLCRIRLLEWLDLSSTSLNTIHLASTSLYCECLLPNLRFLNLSNNHIDSLPMGSPLFGSNLTTLYLSHNDLQNISLDTLNEAPFLESLYLDNNQLTSFDYRSAGDHFKNLTDFTFDNNNFNNTFYNAMKNYWDLHLEKRKDQKLSKAVIPKDQKEQTKENVPKDPKEPTKKNITNDQKPHQQDAPKDPKAQKEEKEQKNQYLWIWITVPIIVVLLIAVVWLVLKQQGIGCQPV